MIVQAKEHAHGEANVKVQYVLNLIDLLTGELQGQRFNVAFQVLNLATADNRIDIWGFMDDIGESLDTNS